jgi:hypothetical protein
MVTGIELVVLSVAGEMAGVTTTGAVMVYLVVATAELVSPLNSAIASTTDVADTLKAPVYLVELLVGAVPVVPAVRV